MLLASLAANVFLLFLGVFLLKTAMGRTHLAHAFMSALPPWLKYPITVAAFYPTILLTRLYVALGACLPAPLVNPRIRLWSRITPHIVLGVAPVFAGDVEALHRSENVRAVVNLCREWPAEGHAALYAARRVRHLHLPTTDFEPPTLAHALQGVALIDEAVAAGESVYVHCKAGRGRSLCVVMAWLVLREGLSPQQAEEAVAAKRCNVARNKWSLELFRQVVGVREAEEAAAAAAGAAAAPGGGAAALGSSSGAGPAGLAPPAAAARLPGAAATASVAPLLPSLTLRASGASILSKA